MAPYQVFALVPLCILLEIWAYPLMMQSHLLWQKIDPPKILTPDFR